MCKCFCLECITISAGLAVAVVLTCVLIFSVGMLEIDVVSTPPMQPSNQMLSKLVGTPLLSTFQNFRVKVKTLAPIQASITIPNVLVCPAVSALVAVCR